MQQTNSPTISFRFPLSTSPSLLIGLLLFTLGAPVFSFSQTSTSPDSTKKGLRLNEVVIAASKWEEKVNEVPAHMAVVEKKDIQFKNPQTGADLLAASGQVFVQKSQMGGGSPMIRGFAANRILLVVDGVRLNNAIFRSGNLQNAILMDPSNIEAAEVLFGPGSVIYGSDAIGGVMDFHTLSPQLADDDKFLVKGNGLLRYASANFEKTGHFDFNIAGQKFSSLTSFTYSDFDNLRMGSNGPEEYLRDWYVEEQNGVDVEVANPDPEVQVPTAYSQWNILQKFRYQPISGLDLQYALHYTTSSSIPRYDRLIERRGGNPRNGDWYYGPQTWMMHSLQARFTKPTAFFDQARLTLGYQDYEESRNDRNFQSPLLRQRTETVGILNGNLDFRKIMGTRSLVFYGIEALRNKIGSTGMRTNINSGETQPTTTRYPNGSTWGSYAAYASLKHHLTDKLVGQIGARYNFVSMTTPFDTTLFPYPFTTATLNNGALTGSAGLVYQPKDDFITTLNLGTGFRAPNVDDVGKLFDSEPGNVIVPNANLKPEYAYNSDISITRIFAKTLKIGMGAFFTHLRDAHVRRPSTLNGADSIFYDGVLSQVEAIQNGSQANVYGFFLDAEAQLPGGIGIKSRFNYQQGEEELDDGSRAAMRHVAPWFGDLHLTWRWKRILVDLYGQAMGEISNENLAPTEQGKPHIYAQDENGNPYSPAWATVGIRGSCEFNEHLSITIGLENISNQRYRTYSSGIVAPGRNLTLALRAGF